MRCLNQQLELIVDLLGTNGPTLIFGKASLSTKIVKINMALSGGFMSLGMTDIKQFIFGCTIPPAKCIK